MNQPALNNSINRLQEIASRYGPSCELDIIEWIKCNVAEMQLCTEQSDKIQLNDVQFLNLTHEIKTHCLTRDEVIVKGTKKSRFRVLCLLNTPRDLLKLSLLNKNKRGG